MEQIKAKTLINEELPIQVRSLLVSAIKEAYILAEAHFQGNEFLNWLVGKDLLPYLRRVAVEYLIKRLLDNKRLPFQYEIRYNSIRNCRHLEMLTNRSVITISQVPTQISLPRNAEFRNNYRLMNQTTLDFGPKYSLNFTDGPFYILLTHGYARKEPDFICLGVPKPPEEKGWIERINLLKEPHQVQITPSEVITRENMLGFVNHIKEVQQRE